MVGISKLGGVIINAGGEVEFAGGMNTRCAGAIVKMGSTTLSNVVDDFAIELNDTDFSATFDGHLWTVVWK